jgi:3'-phosphoadenosine 5'-phosphosulfate sulfotransferase (PAPS reductase)/FAD synthetase
MSAPAYPDFVLFTSWGNDSIAAAQLLHEYDLPRRRRCVALFSDTGWAEPAWIDRVNAAEQWAQSIGFQTHRTTSVGFADLARKRKTFPRGMMQFCTGELKIEPAKRWVEQHDPERIAVAVNGVRRAESLRRSQTPVFVPISDSHGGRGLWSPLAEFKDDDRNALIARTPFELLPHRSMECSPCIFSSRADLRNVSDARAAEIEQLERDVGRVMFRPKAYAGAEGIREVLRWAHSDRGKFQPQVEDEPDCDGGFCGI